MNTTSPIDRSGNTLLERIRSNSHHFLEQHCVGKYQYPLDGKFCLFKGAHIPDLYGMLDAVYILYTLGELQELTSRDSRSVWADRILACQDDQGWFTLGNKRGHPKEHATAYAIGALRLLEIEADEQYTNQVKPILELRELVTEKKKVWQWLTHMGFRRSLAGIARKNLGWHYVWRGSHVGGGVAAIFCMLKDALHNWWEESISIPTWFDWYFEWLDTHINPKTGYWQRAFWNHYIKKLTVADLGGAAHFYWIYGARGRPFPYPEQTLLSTLQLQRDNGLYKGDKPWCIDLDANYCIIRSYLQLDEEAKTRWHTKVYRAVERNAKAALNVLGSPAFHEAYRNSHELPGALIALIECGKLDDFFGDGELQRWKHPLDQVAWL